MVENNRKSYYLKNLPRKEREKGIYCIIDVNLNRAKEGLRVVGEVARFIFCKKEIVERIKKIRYDLDKITNHIYPELIQARNIEKDADAKCREKGRKNIKDLVIASFKRVEEAIRVLEEFSKLVSSDAGYRFKRMRFKVYDLEKKIMVQFIEKNEKGIK